MMQSVLSGVVLRPVPKTVTDAGPTKSELLADVEKERERNEKLRSVDLETWYSSLEDFTFKTVFVPITPDEAREIATEYKKRKQSQLFEELTPTVSPLLKSLEAKIAAAMRQLGSQAVFAKLSSRSPKDSQFCQNRAFNIVRDSLMQQRSRGASIDIHEILKTVMRASIQCLRLDSAADVLHCFCSSDRVCEDDIPLALSFAHRQWTQHMVLREWLDIPTEAEFRAFVLDGKLNGVSQYFTGAFFPKVVEQKHVILDLIRSLFDNIKSKVPVQPGDYVLDLAINLDTGSAHVIELNPFGRPDGLGTGLCLFDRKNPKDLAVLFGDLPFEFRVETEKPNLSRSQILRDGQLKNFLIEEGFIVDS